jgi:hypothetical protein
VPACCPPTSFESGGQTSLCHGIILGIADGHAYVHEMSYCCIITDVFVQAR